ncbi:Putative Phosphopantothenate-cysteine ligase [Penicillium brasilianum]|uniref:Autophagy-related protein 29 n=1 Tax=Penicillium brasilianum TaxID=104259 RepID=A0A0F7TML7_PENBI|nr:Putative Phosphopantothenate-cysteine ligase [Penicillium brasilianum]
MASRTDPSHTNFTVFIRLPFPRGDFVDPPPVEWNAVKDQALWDILSRPSKGDDIDWKALAEHFDVTLQFLLQQAAWLYDRQLSQVRAQMRRVPPVQSSSPSPAPGSVSGSTALSGQPQKGVAAGGSRAPSRLVSYQKEIPQQTPGGRRRSSTSTTTVNQVRHSRDSSRNETPMEGREQRWENFVRRPSITRREQPPTTSFLRSPTLAEEDLSSSSTESDSEAESSRRAPRFRNFGKFSTQRLGMQEDADEDEEYTPSFLPLSRENDQTPRDRPGEELSATLRLNAERAAAARRQMAERVGHRHPVATESSASSMSSGAPASLTNSDSRRLGQPASALSPHRAGEAPRQSPRKSTTSGREASDGTPSMGSSFSDLDDASVTQSALEEALMSNMQHGGMASRMSTISQALRSRYLQ